MLSSHDHSPFFNFPWESSEDISYYVVHCKPRQEKKLSVLLVQIARPHFLPLYTKALERKAGGTRTRQYESKLPLFPGYLFAVLHRDDLKDPRLNDSSARFIRVKPSEIPHFLRQLEQLARALDSEYSIAPYEHLERGSSVKITGGSLKGLEGFVVEHKEKQTFIIEIDLVGRAVAIDIDAGFLKKIV
ncbi:transcription termination/antitermination NusG family protein [Kamptonema cortianum]|nr:transcription termination/antitermination NusG family protein [Oscillatoria laete-virens]MDK3155364.1 transcription termination/antitermination NusG family protein [Kamptonema cortianum]MDL5046113.1 transcription termination/antitermination NusG family protein [Oscillatoria amoena NRMC-F 0135]MDL5052814.1 transcription termination/antitermination NusG family protein [Oscillatoria laete-virens NRMC-F 0139]